MPPSFSSCFHHSATRKDNTKLRSEDRQSCPRIASLLHPLPITLSEEIQDGHLLQFGRHGISCIQGNLLQGKKHG